MFLDVSKLKTFTFNRYYFTVKPGCAMVGSVCRVTRVPVSAGRPSVLSVNVVCGNMAAGMYIVHILFPFNDKEVKREILRNF